MPAKYKTGDFLPSINVYWALWELYNCGGIKLINNILKLQGPFQLRYFVIVILYWQLCICLPEAMPEKKGSNRTKPKYWINICLFRLAAYKTKDSIYKIDHLLHLQSILYLVHKSLSVQKNPPYTNRKRQRRGRGKEKEVRRDKRKDNCPGRRNWLKMWKNEGRENREKGGGREKLLRS